MAKCFKCAGGGQVYQSEDLHRSAGFVPCESCGGTGNVADAEGAEATAPSGSSEDSRVDAAFKRMFRSATAEGVARPLESAAIAPSLKDVQRQKEKALRHGLHYQAGTETFVRSLEGYVENASDIVDLDACRKDINPNGVHVLVRDRLVALETQDMNVSFDEQQRLDLPPQITMLEKFEVEVMGQLLMNELSCDDRIPSEVLHYWLDVFQFMGPDYFAVLKKLVAKLEWTV